MSNEQSSPQRWTGMVVAHPHGGFVAVSDFQILEKENARLRAALATPAQPATAADNGGKTGSPPGLLQDDSRKLFDALASKPDARRRVREVAEEIREQAAQPEAPSNDEDWLDTAYERLRMSCQGAGEVPPTLPTFVRGLITMVAPVMGAAQPEAQPNDMVMFDGPRANPGLDEAVAALNARIEAAGGLETWRAQPEAQELPAPLGYDGCAETLEEMATYTADQMRAYARAAIAQERERRSNAIGVLRELVEIRDLQRSRAQAAAHASKFPTDENYAVVDALETATARRTATAWPAARAALKADSQGGEA